MDPSVCEVLNPEPITILIAAVIMVAVIGLIFVGVWTLLDKLPGWVAGVVIALLIVGWVYMSLSQAIYQDKKDAFCEQLRIEQTCKCNDQVEAYE